MEHIIDQTVMWLCDNEIILADWASNFDYEDSGVDFYEEICKDDNWRLDTNPKDIDLDYIKECFEGGEYGVWNEEDWDSAKEIKCIAMISKNESLQSHGYVIVVTNENYEIIGCLVVSD